MIARIYIYIYIYTGIFFDCLEVIGRPEWSNKWANCCVNDLSSGGAVEPVFNSAAAIRNTLTQGFDGEV